MHRETVQKQSFGDITIPFECISKKCSLKNLIAGKVRRSLTAVSTDEFE